MNQLFDRDCHECAELKQRMDQIHRTLEATRKREAIAVAQRDELRRMIALLTRRDDDTDTEDPIFVPSKRLFAETYITIDGERMSYADVCRVNDVDIKNAQQRIRDGWAIEAALTRPVRKRGGTEPRHPR